MASARVFLINLDRSPDRLAHMQVEFRRVGMAFERFPGVDGAILPSGSKPYFCDASGAIVSRLNPGEIGCYASHIAVWQRIAAMGAPASLVCEDDISLGDDLPDLLDAAIAILPAGWDVVRLVDYDRMGYKKPLTVALLPSGRKIIRYWQLPMGAGAYLVSGSGARKLLKPGIRRRGVDADLRRPWVFGLAEYGIHPAPVLQPPTMPSLIGEDRGCHDARSPLPAVLRRWRKSLLKIRQHAYTIETVGWRPWLQTAMQ